VLLTTLSVMLILMILSFAIVTMSANNLQTAGNINSRFQALNLATTASMYALYEIQSGRDTSLSVWGPGPTPLPSSPSFVVYEPIPDANLNGLPGRCNVAYVTNLDNPNPVTVNVPGSIFPSYTGSTVELAGESAIVLAQGQYEGYKRAIQIILKHTYHGMVADGDIELGGGILLVGGLENFNSFDPCPCAIYAKGDIKYSDVTAYNFVNGSKLYCGGSVIKVGGNDIPPMYFKENHSGVGCVEDWNIGDPNLTLGNPANPSDYTLLTPANTEIVPGVTSIARPSYPAPSPSISDNRRYTRGILHVWNNTFINGSLHITGGQSLCIWSGNLFINGTLKVDGQLSLGNGNLFVAGYYNDPAFPSSYGLAVEVDNVGTPEIDGGAYPGHAIFADGNVKLKTNASYYPPLNGVNPTSVNEWLKVAPLDTQKVVDTFRNLSISGSWAPDFLSWYNTGIPSLSWSKLPKIPGKTGKQILHGGANDELIAMGLEPVPDEVAAWFNSPYADEGIKRAANAQWWTQFPYNPSSYKGVNDHFIEAVIYTYGTLSTEGSPHPIRIVGGVIAKDKPGVSPPTLAGVSYGGKIKLPEGSSIILCPEYFRNVSGIPLVEPILTIYAWEELY